MVTIPFLYVQLIALCCYGFLLFTVLATKKNSLIRSFILLLLTFIGWTGGALLMRMLVFPGYKLWYEISLLSLFTAPVLMYEFVCAYTGKNYKKTRLFFWVGTIIALILTYLEVFLPVPELVKISGDQMVFIYSASWGVIMPALFFGGIVVVSSALVISSIKNNNTLSSGLTFVAIGMGLLLFGNLLSVIPGNTFPFDTLAGILYAITLFLSLYKKRLLNLQLLVSGNTVALSAVVFASIIFYYFLEDINNFILRLSPVLAKNYLFISNILFLMVVGFVHYFAKKINARLYRAKKDRDTNIKGYSSRISKTLKVNEISSELISVINSLIKIENIYICLKDEKSKSYKTVSTSSPLSRKDFMLREDNPCVTALIKGVRDEETVDCLLLSEFSRTVHYRAMWEREKEELSKINAACLVPLKADDYLYGIIVISLKANKVLTNEDISYLDAVSSITSIAIKNAHLYEKVYNDARTDDLTGLLNRKFFYEQLDELMEKSKNDVLSLLFLNIDDFKLYNQLYGYYEGDNALKEIANIIKTNLGEYGIAVRYSGKVFAIILPRFDSAKALFLAEKITNQLAQKAHSKLKTLTLSGGIATYPCTASTINQLLQNVEMAVYNAKFSGKNKIVTYASGKVYEKEVKGNSLTPSDKYSEYAATIHALTAAIDVKDHVTFGHSQRVAQYAVALGKEIELDNDHVKIIKEAALLHDVGKIGIAEKILTKTGRLDDEEYMKMKKHVENSIEIIKHLPALDYLIPVAISHHERWDGRGYPRGIKGEDIPIGGRCLAIADAFDAMTSERQYKKSLPIEFAIEELRKNAGTQFDPKLAVIFVDMVNDGKIVVESNASIELVEV